MKKDKGSKKTPLPKPRKVVGSSSKLPEGTWHNVGTTRGQQTKWKRTK